METFNTRSDEQAKRKAAEAYGPNWPSRFHAGRRSAEPGRTAVWQARLVLLVMINVAQLWILAATIEAALAREFSQLIPLISASVVCWLIALTIFVWWKPTTGRNPSAGPMRK